MNENWELKTLDDVCEIIKRGIAPKYTEQNGITIINQKCIRNHTINLSVARLHNLELKKVSEEKFIKIGDVLINSTGIGTLGRVAQVRDRKLESCTVDTHVTIVRPKSELFYMDFFGYALIKIENEIEKAGEGASGQTELSRVKLQNEFEISYPTCKNEQKQIVEVLDKTFEFIEKAKINIEKNLQNSKDLFASKLNEIFSQKGDDWEAKELGKLLIVLTDYHANGSYKILKKHVEIKEEEDFAWMVRSTDFEKDFKKDFRYITEDAYNFLSKSKVFSGDMIISKIGNAGKVYIMPEIEEPCSLAMNLFLLRFNNEIINQYLYYYLLSDFGEKQIKSKLKGTTTQTITKDSIRSLIIPITSITNQKKVICEFDKLNEETKQLEQQYQQKLDNLEELKKSILEKAFSGELLK